MAKDVRIAILGDSRDFHRAAKSAGDDADRLGRDLHKTGDHFSKFAKGLAIGAGALVVAGVALGKGFVDAAIESQKVTKQTAAVIKSMGGASKVTAQHVAKLSTKLSLMSGVDDELIQSAQNVLLTFGKVRNEVGKGNQIFDRASQSALDMSVALGTDMQGAAIMLGKALNDPVKGITAMTRAGVSFTEQQKDQIKWMVAAGDTLGAQKLILGEMEKQFGGSAAAQATAVDKLKVVWGNLQEELGTELLPVVEAVATWLGENLPGAMETLHGWIDNTLKPALESAGEWFDTHMREPMRKVADYVVNTLIPNLGQFIAWISNSKPALYTLGGIVGVYLVGAMVAYAAAAVTAGIATIVATWPIWLMIAAVAAAIGILYLLTHREGQSFLQWLAMIGIMAYTAGVSIVGMFRTVWGWAMTAYHAVRRLASAIQDVIDLAPHIPKIGGTSAGGFLPGPFGVLGGLFKADGGPVVGGNPYIVGENGPEWFVPGSSGTIIPNGASTGGGGGASQTLQPIQLYLDSQVLVDALVRQGERNGPLPIKVR